MTLKGSTIGVLGILMSIGGFVAGTAYRVGENATRLEQVETTLAAHVIWSEKRSEQLTRNQQDLSNTALAMQQMAGDIQQMQRDVRQIRDYYLRRGGTP